MSKNQQNLIKDPSVKSLFLATTAIESSWGDELKTVFLGEWCKKFSRKEAWQSKNIPTVDYHWRDRKKLYIDHQYLEEFYESTLEILFKDLNNFHNTELPKQSWRIIIGPWLYSYLSVIWDRWEALSIFQESYLKNNFRYKFLTKAFTSSQDSLIPHDFNQFREFLDSDWWNHLIFIKIIKFRADVPINIINLDKELPIDSNFNNDPRASLSFARKIFSILIGSLDFLIEKFSSNNQNITFFHSYFPRMFLLKLCFSLKIFPRWHNTLKNQSFYEEIQKRRRNFKISNLNSSNNFEKFIQEILPSQIPYCYIENFSKLVKLQSLLPNSKLIFTANAYIYNEKFKVWTAFQVAKKSKLIISSHGGAMYPLFNNFDHEEKISFIRIVWGEPWLSSQERLPPNKLFFQIKNYSLDGQISLIDYEASRYGFRCVTAPIGPLVLDVVDKNIQLMNALKNKNLLKDLKIRVKGLNSWETKLRYQEKFNKDIFCTEALQTKTIQKSRLVVCTYPQTSFAEAMFSGVPTILYYIEDLWEVQEIYHSLLKKLKDANILFTDPQKAADHIKAINLDPMQWWQAKETVDAREEFNRKCLTLDSQPIQAWKDFFQSCI